MVPLFVWEVGGASGGGVVGEQRSVEWVGVAEEEEAEATTWGCGEMKGVRGWDLVLVVEGGSGRKMQKRKILKITSWHWCLGGGVKEFSGKKFRRGALMDRCCCPCCVLRVSNFGR